MQARYVRIYSDERGLSRFEDHSVALNCGFAVPPAEPLFAADFMEKLVALEKKSKIGRLYVITGRATFSAGISHAAYLKQYSNATFVGEPIGDELDTWSEGGNIVLPNSGLTVHFTNGFHSLSAVEHPECERYKWSDLDLTDLTPDILVRTSSEDYLSGRDPVLEAILAAESR